VWRSEEEECLGDEAAAGEARRRCCWALSGLLVRPSEGEKLSRQGEQEWQGKRVGSESRGVPTSHSHSPPPFSPSPLSHFTHLFPVSVRAVKGLVDAGELGPREGESGPPAPPFKALPPTAEAGQVDCGVEGSKQWGQNAFERQGR
jgi:hypothetical protein